MYKTILLSVDLHDEASWRKALPTALELCRAFGSTLHVLTVVPNLPMSLVGMYLQEDTLTRLTETLDRDLDAFMEERVPKDVNAHRILEWGTPYAVIVDVAERIGADLIVMGSHRPEMSDYLLGPNAGHVVRHSKVSVLVVREERSD